MNGAAHKYIYDFAKGPNKGATVSRLDFTFDNIPVVSGTLAWRVTPSLSLNVMGRMKLDGASTVDDYDFNLPFCPPSGSGTLCHSHHEDTTVDIGRALDVSAALTLLDWQGLRLSALAGYRSERYRWSAVGGTSNNGFIAPDTVVIVYDQRWQAPYAGLDVSYTSRNWRVKGRLAGSMWGDADDFDDHRNNYQTFAIEMDNVPMVSAAVESGIVLSPGVELTAGYDYQVWLRTSGSLDIHNLAIMARAFIPASDEPAGAEFASHTFSVGLKYRY